MVVAVVVQVVVAAVVAEVVIAAVLVQVVVTAGGAEGVAIAVVVEAVVAAAVAGVFQVVVAPVGAARALGNEAIELVGSRDYTRIGVQKVAIKLVVLSDTLRVVVPISWVV